MGAAAAVGRNIAGCAMDALLSAPLRAALQDALQDPWTMLVWALAHAPLFPVFNAVHYLLVAYYIRLQHNGTALPVGQPRGRRAAQCVLRAADPVAFSRRWPFASFVTTFLVANGGSILLSLLFGQPIACFADDWNVLLCFAAWYRCIGRAAACVARRKWRRGQVSRQLCAGRRCVPPDRAPAPSCTRAGAGRRRRGIGRGAMRPATVVARRRIGARAAQRAGL